MDENRAETLLTAMRWRPGIGLGDIARRPPRLRGSGWDNEMWEIGALPDGTAVVLRLPHRELARPLLAREALALTALESTPITTPRLLATLDTEHPDGPALLVTWLNGELLLDRVAGTAPEDPAVRAHARSLARALSTLHRPVGPEHPRSAVRGVPLAEVAARMESDLRVLPSTLRTTGGEPAREVLEEVFAAGLAAPAWDGPALFLHGDPHPGNLLVVPAPGTPSGEDLALLDWGDVTAGDPPGTSATCFCWTRAAPRWTPIPTRATRARCTHAPAPGPPATPLPCWPTPTAGRRRWGRSGWSGCWEPAPCGPQKAWRPAAERTDVRS